MALESVSWYIKNCRLIKALRREVNLRLEPITF